MKVCKQFIQSKNEQESTISPSEFAALARKRKQRQLATAAVLGGHGLAGTQQDDSDLSLKDEENPAIDFFPIEESTTGSNDDDE